MDNICNYLVSQDIDVNCVDPVVKGIEPNGILINRDDIDFSASKFSSTNPNVLESIVLKTGKKGYKVAQSGGTPFTGTSTKMVTGTNRNSYDNVVQLVILDNSPAVCRNIIDGLANGSFVAVLENKYKNMSNEAMAGGAAFQVYGWHQGLKATQLDNEKYSDDTEGGWLCQLTESKTPKSGLFLFKTSYDTTCAMVKTLTEIAV